MLACDRRCVAFGEQEELVGWRMRAQDDSGNLTSHGTYQAIRDGERWQRS